MDLQIRFCTAADGTRIGYGMVGTGRALLVVYSWGCNIESDWDNPTCRAAIERLAEGSRVIALMRRGFGSSQREVDDLSLGAQVLDIRAVADALSLDNFDLFAFQDGIGPAVAFAVQDPGRVARLILWDAFTRGEEVIDQRAGQNIIELVRANWGLATRTFANLGLPNGPAEEERWLAHAFRQSITPEMSARYLQFLFYARPDSLSAPSSGPYAGAPQAGRPYDTAERRQGGSRDDPRCPLRIAGRRHRVRLARRPVVHGQDFRIPT
jgi:pimeloyl-ACP methyl ester carboxylesterase